MKMLAVQSVLMVFQTTSFNTSAIFNTSPKYSTTQVHNNNHTFIQQVLAYLLITPACFPSNVVSFVSSKCNLIFTIHKVKSTCNSKCASASPQALHYLTIVLNFCTIMYNINFTLRTTIHTNMSSV